MLDFSLSLTAPRRVGILPETRAVAARMSAAPPPARLSQMDALIRSLKNAGVWAKLDLLAILAAHHEQAGRLNWISSSYGFAAYNAPTFTTDRGFRGDGVSAYMTATGYAPSGASLNYTLNSASMGVWVRAVSTVAGLDVYSGPGRLSRRDTTTDDYHVRVNDGTSYYGPGGLAGGFLVGDRPDSATKRRFLNGVLGGSQVVASTGNAAQITLFSTGSGSYSNAEISAFFSGASLTEAQHAALYSAIRAYLVTLGATT